MERLLLMAKTLGKEVSASDCYLAYKSARSEIALYPELLHGLFQLKSLQLSHSLREQAGETIPPEETKELRNRYSALMLHAPAAKLWHSERALVTLLASLFDTISEEAPISLEYQEDVIA